MAAEPLATQWRTLWPGADEATVARVYTDLVSRYADPQRAYHTLDHITDCLRHFDAVRHLAAWPAAVELAIWFHDAIYDPQRGDNETRSAELAEVTLRALAGDRLAAATQAPTGSGLPAAVGRLIRLTSHAHAQPPATERCWVISTWPSWEQHRRCLMPSTACSTACQAVCSTACQAVAAAGDDSLTGCATLRSMRPVRLSVAQPVRLWLRPATTA